MTRLATIAGIIAGILAGIGSIVAAVIFKKAAFGVWGGVFIVGSIVAAVSGATATPGGSLDPSVKASFKGIPAGATFVIMGLVVVGIVMTFILPPWK